MSKYKFRLSYKENNKLIPIELDKIDKLKDKDIIEIKTIDEYTTSFSTYDELLRDLKNKGLIPEHVIKLYITFDVKENKETIQQLYAFNETLFFENDIKKLRTSYVCNIIRNHIRDGKFMQNAISYFAKKNPHKNYGMLERISYDLSTHGDYVLTPSEYSEYIDGIEDLINYVFFKKDKEGNLIPSYRKCRDFICYLGGENPIATKNIKSTPTQHKQITIDEVIEEYCEEDSIGTYRENKKYNKEFVKNYGLDKEGKIDESLIFEPYRDGNDWIAPITPKEIRESLDSYAKKLCLKRDNGEYE